MKTRLIVAFTCLVMILATNSVEKTVFADTHRPAGTPFTSRIDYRFVGHLEQFDNDGRLLVWEATVDGALAGQMKWWFVNPSPLPAANYDGMSLSYYNARWEIWSGNELLLAGESAGKTVFPEGADGVWDGHGIVTEAAAKFQSLEGRRIYETGAVIVGANPPLSYAGSGLFVIY